MKPNGKIQLFEFEARLIQVGDSLAVIVPFAKRRGLKLGDRVRVAIVGITQAERERIQREAVQITGMIIDEWQAASEGEIDSETPRYGKRWK